MKLWIMAALIALMTVSAYPRAVEAQVMPRSGNWLLEHCEAEKTSFGGILCRGFIAGAGDGFQHGGAYEVGAWRFCYPEGNTVDQAVRIVTKYLGEHPEWLHDRAGHLVGLAFIEAWPCD